VSFRHLEWVADREDLPPQQKLILWQIGSVACKHCGLAWPGTRYLATKTGLGEKSVVSALRELKTAGLIDVQSYSKGGRGRTTEYVVLGRYLEFAPAPCRVCLENMKTPQGSRGIDPEKPLKGEGVSGVSKRKPPLSAAGNPSRETVHTVSILTQSGKDPSASPPGAAAPPSSDDPREQGARNDEILRRIADGARPTPATSVNAPGTPTGKPRPDTKPSG